APEPELRDDAVPAGARHHRAHLPQRPPDRRGPAPAAHERGDDPADRGGHRLRLAQQLPRRVHAGVRDAARPLPAAAPGPLTRSRATTRHANARPRAGIGDPQPWGWRWRVAAASVVRHRVVAIGRASSSRRWPTSPTVREMTPSPRAMRQSRPSSATTVPMAPVTLTGSARPDASLPAAATAR